MSTLYVVATPIGNLEDITLRALRILKEVDLVLCEDTRVTKRLLARYEISTPTMGYHARSSNTEIEHIIELLKQGKNLALVSDAGTPGISDPGSLLVSRVRDALSGAVSIVPIPGASALPAALSIAGVPASDTLFLGFLPHKKGRETLLREVVASSRTVVLYESPHRILKTLSALANKISGDSKRRIVVCRELTKKFEEIALGTATHVRQYFIDHPEKVKGEFVVIVEGT